MTANAKRPTLYVSLDVETDGPAPGLNSMLSLGACVFSKTGEELGLTWSANFLPLAEAHEHPEYRDWWAGQMLAWSIVQENRRDPGEAMAEFVAWLEDLPGEIVAVAGPVAFDMSFVTYYCERFTGERPLGFDGVDIKSLVWGLARAKGYRGVERGKVNTLLDTPIDTKGLLEHVALHDAIRQGRVLGAILRGLNEPAKEQADRGVGR